MEGFPSNLAPIASAAAAAPAGSRNAQVEVDSDARVGRDRSLVKQRKRTSCSQRVVGREPDALGRGVGGPGSRSHDSRVVVLERDGPIGPERNQAVVARCVGVQVVINDGYSLRLVCKHCAGYQSR
jgi:hypothetical protein